MAIELAHAYVSILPETSKIAPGVAKALGGAEKTADKSGKSIGSKLSTGMGSVLKKSAVGVGAAAGAALGAGLTKGIGRLNSIEQAEAKLKGLGHSAQSVGGIMENSLAAVKGTAFGLEEAATTAAGVVAAGIKPGKELEQVLKTVGDTATIAGTSMSEMGTIFGSVAARGKLQGDDMLQLMSRGVPVLQLLGDELGKTSAEISDMVSKGQIDFATFERAMRKGMGGAALEAGNTVQGAMRNMGAAAGRLGATLAGPFFKRAAGGFNGVTAALDAMDARMKPVMANVDKWLTGTAAPAFEQFGRSAASAFESFKNSGTVARTVDVFKSLGQTAMDLAPTLVNIGSAVAQASAALGIGTWQMFLTALEAVGLAAKALTPPLEAISSVMSEHPSLVLAAVAAWQGFRPVPGFMQTATDAVKKHVGGLKNLRAGVSDIQAYYKASGQEIGKFSAAMQLAGTSSNKALQAMGQGYSQASAGLQKVAAAHRQSAVAAKANALQSKDAFTAIDFMGQQAAHSFVASTASMGAAAKGLVSGGLNVVKNSAKGLISAFGGPWGAAFAGATFAVTAAIQGLNDMGRVLDAQRDLAANASTAYTSMFDAIVSGGNQLEVAKTAVDSMTSSMQTMADNGPNWFHRGLLAIEEHTYGLVGLKTEYMEAGASVRHMSDSAKAAQQTMKDLGITNEQLAAAATGSSVAYENMHQKLMESGRGGEFLAGELERLRQKFLESQAAADAMGPAGARFAQVLDEISSKTGTAEDRASKLRIALLELSGIKLSAAEAGAQLTSTIDQVAQQMGSFEGATVGANGQLDVTTKAGVDAHNALMDLGDAMQRSVASGNDINDVYGQFESQLSGLQGQLGLTDEAYQQLLDSYGLTPEKLTTVAEVQDDAAKSALVGLNAEIKKNTGEKTVTMKVADAGAQKQLEQMGFKLEKLDENGTVEINVADESARAKLDNFVTKIGQANEKVARPTVDANTAPADSKLDVTDGKLVAMNGKKATSFAVLNADGLFATADFATAQLMTLDLARPMPWANMDLSQLDAKHLEALQKVGLLDGQTPTPDAYMNIEELSGEQQAALAKVFDLDSQRPTPLANLDKNELDSKADTASRRLTTLANQKTEPKVTANTTDAISKLDSVLSRIRSIPSSVTTTIKSIFVNEHRATGGVVGGTPRRPGYADGGRLSPSMRGSHTTDGILGVSEYGMPTARVDAGEWIINRRSSSKYNGLLDAINRDDPRLQKFKGSLPGYADGGVASPDEIRRFVEGESVNGHQARRPLNGAPYDWGGINWGDCSGAMSAIARFAVGIAPFAARFTTMTEEAELAKLGFTPGKGSRGDLRMAWYNGGAGGGHTWGELPDGTAVEMRGGGRGGILGADAWTIDNGKATSFAHLPVKVFQATTTMAYGEEGAYEYGNGPVDAGAVTWDDSGSTSSGTAGSAAGDEYIVPLSPEAGAAAETLDSADPGLLGGASTWSDFGGSVVAAAVSGQIADVLGVFGIPNELPPVVKAGQQWYQAAREANQKTADFMNAEADLIRAADAVEEAQANPDAVADAVDATVEVDATSTAADAVSEVAEPAPDVPEWGEGFFAHEIARAAIDSGFNHEGEAYDAAQIALATALVESGSPMKMYANNAVPESLNYRHDAVGSDHDSVGLFQQRDNGAWGTVAQRMDPYESAKLFFDALKKVDWQNMEPGAAAQAVQRSAFPGRYSVQLDKAGNLAFETGLFVYNAQANRNDVKKVPAFKKGGMVAGGAGKNLDDVLAWLSNGEMVINSDSVDADPGMAQTLNEQGPDAVKAQVLSEYAPVSPNASVEPEKRVVQTFDVDPGSLQNTINGALPMLMAQNSWADAAKLVTSSAVSFAGNMATSAASGAVDMVAEAGMSALGMAGAPTLGAMVGAATAPVTGALGPAAGAMAGTAAAPFGSLLGQVMPLTPGDMVGAAGGVMTDAAAWYAGEVAWGVTNAFEQYSKDLFGTVLLPFQDVMGVLKSPVVGDLAAQAGIDIPGGRSFADMVPEPVKTAASEMGNVYNFYATNREGMYSDFRRELAKDSKGLIGAR